MKIGGKVLWCLAGGILLSGFGVGVAKKIARKHDLAEVVNKTSIKPLVVIGSGPAGLNAAVYGARLGIDTLVIRGDNPGGLIAETSWVENWPGSTKILGPDIVANLTEQAALHGAQFLDDVVESVDFDSWPFKITTEYGKTINALAVIIATGSVPRKLGVQGEQEYWGAGVSACAVCDAPLYKDKDVMVVGGGDSAIEEAIQLSQYAKKITILVRRNAMRASASMQDRLVDYPMISVSYATEIAEICGQEGMVTQVKLRNTNDGTMRTESVDGIFLAVGHEPNTQLFKEHIALDEQSRHIQLAKRTKETSVEGVFAAGDVEDNRYRQACVAAGSGAQAALDAQEFLASIGLTKQLASTMKTFTVDTATC